jgi:hypothetical protein
MNVRVLNAKQAFGRDRNRCRTDLGVAASGWVQSIDCEPPMTARRQLPDFADPQ